VEVVASLSLKVAQLLRSAACLHTNQSRSYLNHLVFSAKSCLCQHNFTCKTRKCGVALFFGRIRTILCFPSSEKTLNFNFQVF